MTETVAKEPAAHGKQTAYQYRYQVTRVELPLVVDGVSFLELSSAVYVAIIGTNRAGASTFSIRLGVIGDWIRGRVCDRFRVSPIERIYFQNLDGAATTLMILTTNDPMFEWTPITSPATSDRGVFNTA